MTNLTGATGSIMGGRNEQASLRYHNNNCEIRNVLSKGRIRKARTLPGLPAKTVATNEAENSADTCSLGTNFIPLAYKNQ